jgi:hypothetical protein
MEFCDKLRIMTEMAFAVSAPGITESSLWLFHVPCAFRYDPLKGLSARRASLQIIRFGPAGGST